MSTYGMNNIEFLVNIEKLQEHISKEYAIVETAAKKKKVLTAFKSCEKIKQMIFEHDGATYDVMSEITPIATQGGESMKPLVDFICYRLSKWKYITGKNGRFDLDDVKVELEKVKKAI